MPGSVEGGLAAGQQSIGPTFRTERGGVRSQWLETISKAPGQKKESGCSTATATATRETGRPCTASTKGLLEGAAR